MNGVFDRILFPVTSGFREIDSAHPHNHVGVDIAMPTGTDVLSPDNGVIEHIVHQGHEGLGEGIIMKLQDGKELTFGHLSQIDVKEGDIISIGQKIADSGNTGHSTGSHLHISLQDTSGHYINPSHYADMMAQLDQPSKWAQFKHFFSSPVDGWMKEIDSIKDFFRPFRDFFVWCGRISSDVKEHGFLPWLGDQILYTFKLGFEGILYFDELLFLFPAIAAMVAYFVVGKNKYTRWIVPLWFFYFVAEIMKAQLSIK
jgi:hypothetical protein